jgi:hypothetical protein
LLTAALCFPGGARDSALDDGARMAIAGALPALFQLAERLGESPDDSAAAD